MNVRELAHEVARLLRAEDVVVMLGAGVSLGIDEEQGMPSSDELAELVAEEFNVPFRQGISTLDGITSLAAKQTADVSAVKGFVARTIRDRTVAPLRAHRALARIAPHIRRAKIRSIALLNTATSTTTSTLDRRKEAKMACADNPYAVTGSRAQHRVKNLLTRYIDHIQALTFWLALLHSDLETAKHDNE